MISRRQIIKSQQELNRQQQQASRAGPDLYPNRVGIGEDEPDDDESSCRSKAFVSRKMFRQQAEMLSARRRSGKQGDSREFELDPEENSARCQGFDEQEDDSEPRMAQTDRGKQATSRQHPFDPYSVYGEEDEEEDVWYSEERLFEVSLLSAHRALRRFVAAAVVPSSDFASSRVEPNEWPFAGLHLIRCRSLCALGLCALLRLANSAQLGSARSRGPVKGFH